MKVTVSGRSVRKIGYVCMHTYVCPFHTAKSSKESVCLKAREQEEELTYASCFHCIYKDHKINICFLEKLETCKQTICLASACMMSALTINPLRQEGWN